MACGFHAASVGSGSFPPRVKELKRGGMWVSHHLAGLSLVPGVNELEQGGMEPTPRLARFWPIPRVKEPERGGVGVSRCLARLRLIPSPLCPPTPCLLLDSLLWRPHPSMRGGAAVGYAAVYEAGMLVAMQMCGQQLWWLVLSL